MKFSPATCLLASVATISTALPTGQLSSPPSPLPIAGQYAPYNTQLGRTPPFPGSTTGDTLPTSNGTAAPDDLLFQNLLSAEWIIYSFYQQGVEKFNQTAFVEAGFPNTTYDRIEEIRDNEAGHLEFFYSQISNTSVKPGPCRYEFPFSTAEEFLALQVTIEVSSMAFLTGLSISAQTSITRGALTAIAEVETRHNTWALIDVWKTNPFAGPADTVYPYANQILQITNNFVVAGSCPKDNPAYPSPNQKIPYMQFNTSTSNGRPGEPIEFVFPIPQEQPVFRNGSEYFAVFMHGVGNITMPFDVESRTSRIPEQFDREKGIIIAVVADEEGARTEDSVVAGPLILVEQPVALSTFS